MVKSIYSEEYQLVLDELLRARKKAGLTQMAVADTLGRPQSFVSKYEKGERRLDVIEFLAVARAVQADPYRILRNVERA